MKTEVQTRGVRVLESNQSCARCLETLWEGEEVAFRAFLDESTLRRREFFAHLGACAERL